jgi:hypothetical protein
MDDTVDGASHYMVDSVRITYGGGRKQRIVKKMSKNGNIPRLHERGIFYGTESLLCRTYTNLYLNMPYPVKKWKGELAAMDTRLATCATLMAVLELLDDDTSFAILSRRICDRITWPHGKLFKKT